MDFGAKSTDLPRKSTEKKKPTPHIVITKLDFTKKDEFEEKYEDLDKLGEGQHGYVLRVRDRKSDEEFACKVILNLDPEIVESCRNEYESLQKLEHPNIVKVFHFFVNEHKAVRMLMEYLKCQTLGNFIEKKCLKESDTAKIFIQIFDCLCYMHQMGICHRDLNPNNIMIADNLQIKIIDFSVSKWFKINEASTSMWTPTGTPAYKAPEIYQGGAYQEPVDMWAAGVILFECLSGKKPFLITKHLDKLISQIDKGFDNISEEDLKHLPQLAVDLLAKMLNPVPEARLTPAAALQHPWITQFLLKEKD